MAEKVNPQDQQPDHGQPSASDAFLSAGDLSADDLGADDLSAASEFGDELEDFSLDDLGAAYAKAAAEHSPEAFTSPLDPSESDVNAESVENRSSSESEGDDLVTPESIIEGALFVGHPENHPLTEERLAKLIRNMTPSEVVLAIEKLNESYREHGQALRITKDDLGYKMTVAPDVEHVRRSFLGKVRETRLNQAAIEVLSLVAYQPGVSAQKVQDQRGRESNSLLNQLVRRQLLRVDRVKPEGKGRPVPHYYPTERFLFLFGIESLEELPQVEEGLRED